MTALAGVVVGCQVGEYDPRGKPCPCAEGWRCHPEQRLCVPEVPIGCDRPEALCATHISTGDACDPAGIFVPCYDPTDLGCSLGCRTCATDGRWSDCSAGTCGELGTLEHCSRCGDDCLASSQVAAAACVTAGETPACAVIACTPGWLDDNGDAGDGCEAPCVSTGAEVCNGGDDDCDGTRDNEGALGCVDRWRDADADGLGVDGDVRCLCAPVAPYTAAGGGDCDENNPSCTSDCTDTDGDDLCDPHDPDDDGDTVLDAEDVAPLDASRCLDTDTDGCDDCAVTGGPPAAAADGNDADGDGACDAGDACTDADGDGVGTGTLGNAACATPVSDADDTAASLCADVDGDTCEDCLGGSFAPAADGEDGDADGLCDAGDPDADGDGIAEDGDGSGLDGDHPCSAGATAACDDNCPAVANPTQADSDGDGRGDFCDLVVEPLYPTAGAKWNDFVANDGADAFSAQDQACALAATSRYADCIHGGEKRQVRLPWLASCAGVSAYDSLDALVWECRASPAPVRVVSRGLRSSAGLTTLLDAAAWKVNAVVVNDGVRTLSTAPAVWWSNPVAPLPASSSAPVVLSTPGVVYTVAAGMTTQGYVVNADRVAIAVFPTASLQHSGTMTAACSALGESESATLRAVLCVGAQRGVWLEGPLAAGNTQYGIYAHDLAGSTLRRIAVAGARVAGVALTGAHANLLYDTSARDCTPYCSGLALEDSHYNAVVGLIAEGNHERNVYLVNSSHNIFAGVSASAAALGVGVDLEGASDNTIVGLSSVASHSHNLRVAGGGRNTLTHITSRGAITTANGIELGAGADFTTLVQVVTVGNWGSGLVVRQSQGLRVAQLVSTSQTYDWGIRLDNVSDSHFTGNILVGDNPKGDCSIVGGTNPGLSGNTCTPAGTSDANVVRGVDAGSSFGSPAWVLSATDTVLRLRSGNGLSSNGAAVPGFACPAAVHGDVALTDQQTPANTFLLNAVEILFDGRGDDDGLCESSEACLYSPHFGRYQGQGDYAEPVCDFVDGTVVGVTLYAHADGAL